MKDAGVPIRKLGSRAVVWIEDLIKAMPLSEDVYQRHKAKSELTKKYDNF